MISLLLEQPWTIGILGAVVTIMTVYGWVQTGNPIALKSAIGIFVITILIVLISVFVETDREKIRVVVLETAKELENNQFERVLKRIHPVHTEAVDRGISLLPQVKFFTLNINSIHDISVESKRVDPKATVRMNIFVDAERNGFRGKAPRWLRLTLLKSDGKWLISDYEHREPQYEFMNQPTAPLQQLDDLR